MKIKTKKEMEQQTNNNVNKLQKQKRKLTLKEKILLRNIYKKIKQASNVGSYSIIYTGKCIDDSEIYYNNPSINKVMNFLKLKGYAVDLVQPSKKFNTFTEEDVFKISWE